MAENATNLKLKWGSFKNLPSNITASDIGTIFVTKDEGSLYLGVTEGAAPMRIQGTVQYHETLISFAEGVQPPYSDSIIYYIASENALVRWDGNATYTNEQGETKKGKFIRLNVTASEFDTLSQSVSANQANIATISGDVTKNKGDIAGLTDRTIELEAAVAALQELTGAGSTGNSLTSRIAALETWKNTQDSVIAANTSNIAELTENKADKTALDAVGNRVGALETDNTTNKENINSLIGAVATINDTTIPGLAEDISKQTTSIAELNAKFDGYYTKDETNAFINGINKDIGDINTAIGNAETDISALENWKTATVDPAIATVNGHTTSIAQLTKQFENYYTKTQADDLHSALEDEIHSEINAANCLNYRASINKDSDFTAANLTDITIGSTYIVTTTVELTLNGTKTMCYAGDLLIATAASGKTESESGILAFNDVQWVHVQSGYYKTHEGVLSSANSQISLTSLNGTGETGDLGKITLNDGNTATEQKTNFVVDTSTANTIEFKLQWLTF